MSIYNSNLENLQTQILDELDFRFDVIGVSKTKITNANVGLYVPNIPGYNIEFVSTPLASGGVALFNYRILDKTSNEAFQALWVEISFVKKKNIICGVLYRQHNTPHHFLRYFDETIEKFSVTGKQSCILGDFNLDLLKIESSSYCHDFLMSLQSCYLLLTIDKPSRVGRTSATLIDNIFVNIPNQVSISGNIISDISDHFSQFCILKSVAEQTHARIRKVRDYSQFSSDSFTA